MNISAPMTRLRPRLSDFGYTLALLVVVVAGYFPVAMQWKSLKNDMLQLDLPVRYFISQRLHQGEWPVWFYSWAGGFPLGHMFTWSIYNPVTLFFTGLFRYDVYILQLEFIFYLWMGAVGFFVLAHRAGRLSASVSFVLASAYALSGITMSCGQFMAYIAAVGALPWVYAAFWLLLQKPSLSRAVFFAFTFFLLCSWTYPAGIIICAYSLFGWWIWWLVRHWRAETKRRHLGFLALAVLIFLLLASPLLYSTVTIYPYFARTTTAISAADLDFGYLRPLSLSSLVLPLSGTALGDVDAVGLFQNVFIGVVPLAVLMSCFFLKGFRAKYPVAVWLVWLSFVFLLLSFGSSFLLKPLGDRLLPGFDKFRFPSYFRLFFQITALLAAGYAFEYTRESANLQLSRRSLAIFACSAMALSAIILVSVYSNAGTRLMQTLLLVELGVSVAVCAALVIGARHNWRVLVFVAMAELLLQGWLMQPVYVISNYSVSRVQGINRLESDLTGSVSINNLRGVYRDSSGNRWNSRNVYVNEVSAASQYIGPLELRSFKKLQQAIDDLPSQGPLIFARKTGASLVITMQNERFRHNTFSAVVNSDAPEQISLFQLYYPGWKAYDNGKEIKITDQGDGLMTVLLPAGEHLVEFTYHDSLLIFFTIVHFLALAFVTIFLVLASFRHLRKV